MTEKIFITMFNCTTYLDLEFLSIALYLTEIKTAVLIQFLVRIYHVVYPLINQMQINTYTVSELSLSKYMSTIFPTLTLQTVSIAKEIIRLGSEELKLQADKEGNIPLVTAIDSGNLQLCQELLRGEVEAQTSAFKVFYFELTFNMIKFSI